MSQERRQILEMLASGQINVDDADRLLDKITTSAVAQVAAPARYLRLVVDGDNGDKVDVRVPLALIRTGIRLGAMLPEGATAKIDASGFDLSEFSVLAGDELVDALQEFRLEAEDASGESIRIYCE